MCLDGVINTSINAKHGTKFWPFLVPRLRHMAPFVRGVMNVSFFIFFIRDVWNFRNIAMYFTKCIFNENLVICGNLMLYWIKCIIFLTTQIPLPVKIIYWLPINPLKIIYWLLINHYTRNPWHITGATYERRPAWSGHTL